MKKLIILFIAFSTLGCDNSPKTKAIKKIDHPVKIKFENIQLCLDSISKSSDYDIYSKNKFTLVKDDRYTTGLDSLHFRKSKIQIQNVILKENKDYYHLESNTKRIYIRIKYLPKSENDLEIFIELLNISERYHFYLIKQTNGWAVKKIDWSIS